MREENSLIDASYLADCLRALPAAGEKAAP